MWTCSVGSLGEIKSQVDPKYTWPNVTNWGVPIFCTWSHPRISTTEPWKDEHRFLDHPWDGLYAMGHMKYIHAALFGASQRQCREVHSPISKHHTSAKREDFKNMIHGHMMKYLREKRSEKASTRNNPLKSIVVKQISGFLIGPGCLLRC